MNKIETFLEAESSASYAEFSKKLTPTKYQILGVSLPKLKKFSKTIVVENINLKEANSIEELLLFSYCASALKSESEQLACLQELLPYIDNWEVCDCSIQALRKLDGETTYRFLSSLLADARPFYVRVGVVGLMRYFIKSKHIDEIVSKLIILSNSPSGNSTNKSFSPIDNHYVKMAIAWFWAELCVFDIEKAKENISKIKNKFIRNKSISKAHDSFRILQENKVALAQMRIK